MKRSQLYGPVDFLASYGGLMGLFMGVSILSIVEFVYFFTVRLCTRFVKHRNTQIEGIGNLQ